MGTFVDLKEVVGRNAPPSYKICMERLGFLGRLVPAANESSKGSPERHTPDTSGVRREHPTRGRLSTLIWDGERMSDVTRRSCRLPTERWEKEQVGEGRERVGQMQIGVGKEREAVNVVGKESEKGDVHQCLVQRANCQRIQLGHVK